MSRLLLFTIAAVTALSSCSVSRTERTNTVDDVYFSPTRPGVAYAEVDQRREGRRIVGNTERYEDNWLRMRVRDRYRWNSFDDYNWNDWRYNSYAMGAYTYNPYYTNFNNYYWLNYYTWNTGYNPYYGGVIVVNPKSNQQVYNKVRNFNVTAYTGRTYNNTNRPADPKLRYQSNYNNTNNRTTTNPSLGSTLRSAFNNGNSNSRGGSYSNGSNDRPVRSYQPSSSGSSSSSYTPSYTPSSSSSSSSSSSAGRSSSSGSSSSSSGGSSGGGGGASRPVRN